MRSLLILLVLSACTARAQDADMRFFVGTWDFRGWSGPDTTRTPDLTATWTLENGLDSVLALTGHVVINGSTFTRELITHDPYTRIYTRTITANNGSHFVFTSSGWLGDKLIWLGTEHSATGSTDLKEVIERTSPASFRAIFSQRVGERWELQRTELLERSMR